MPKSARTTIYPMRLAKRPASYWLLVTILIACAACSAKNVPVHIEFSASWAGQPVQCDDTPLALTDLRFYVSDVLVIDSSGAEHPVSLMPDERWQQQNIALIDLENGAGACSNGTSDVNTAIRGTVATSDFAGVRFTIGVPFDMNHANPLLAQPPLNDAAMHWHWRSGYKFLRAGISSPTDSFWIHLGSTGCEGTIQNITGCSFPNRVTVNLADFSADGGQIALELSELFHAIDLQDGTGSDCSSSPAEPECVAPFEALGLTINGPTNRQPQKVFQVQR
jgi:uncharacterized repeat protein (TIGR04052 family)